MNPTRRLRPKPGTHPPADGASKLDPLNDLRRLADHLTPALAGDAKQVRRAVSIALAVGLAHADAAGVGLLAAVVGEQLHKLDDETLAEHVADAAGELGGRCKAVVPPGPGTGAPEG